MTEERWICFRCGFVYVSPTRLKGMTHPCSHNVGLPVQLRKVK